MPDPSNRLLNSDRLKRDVCPTCGAPVVVHSGREGTSHMVPANSADQTNAFIERDQLREAQDPSADVANVNAAYVIERDDNARLRATWPSARNVIEAVREGQLGLDALREVVTILDIHLGGQS